MEVVGRHCYTSGVRVLLLLGLACVACTRTVAPTPAPGALDGAPLASTPAPPSPITRRVVLVSIDGLKPEYLAEADARGLAIPALRRLMKEGARADAMTSVYPTVTYPAHTTLITGVSPKAHGIVNNLPFDPYGKNQDGWYWYASDVKVPTVVDVARKNHLPTANVYWPVTVGAAFDASFPQVWRAQNDEDDKLMRALSTPGLADAVAKEYGAIPAEHRTDVERANAAEWILLHERPALALVYFTDLDTEQHKTGPFSKGACAKLELIDKQLGRLLAASATAGTAAQTTWVVVSDHGFASVHSVVKPGVLLRERGFLTVGAGKVTSFRAAAWKAGGTAAIVLADPKDGATRTAVIAALEEARKDPKNGIAQVVPGATVEAAGGFPGVAAVLVAAEGFMFANGHDGPLVVPSWDLGAHGYPPTDPRMRASFLAAGRGVVTGAKLGTVRMIDVAPTLAALLALSLPNPEGAPIAGLLAP